MEFNPARHMVPRSGSEPRRRDHSRTYYLTIPSEGGNQAVWVYKEMFLRTLDINTARVHYALMKKRVSICDIRRTHNSLKTPAAVIDHIKKHITKFPKYVSHYTRSRSLKEYLRIVHSLSDMYRLYKTECGESGDVPASEWVYRRVLIAI